MDIAKGIERGVKFLVKLIFMLMGVCIALQIVTCWLSRICLSRVEIFELWILLAVACVIAYFIRKHRSPARIRATPHHGGAERTPLMPRRGGRR